MKSVTYVVLASSFLGLAGVALSQSSGGSAGSGSSSTSGLDHETKRTIAFGSAIMARMGSDVELWKSIDVNDNCVEPQPMPEPIPGPMPYPVPQSHVGPVGPDGTTTPDDPTYPPVPNCQINVLYTTAYQLVECPDGTAYITRSGEGVILTSKTTGEIFQWAEGSFCGFPDGGEAPKPEDRMNKNRKLLQSHIIRK